MATGAFTEAGADLVLNLAFRGTGTAPTNLYLGLATVAVTATDTLSTITEVTTAGYSREAVTFGAPTGTDPVQIANTGAAAFGPMTADPPAVAYGFLTDAASGTSGTIYYRWTDDPEDAEINESLEVAIGALVCGIDTTEAAL